MARSNGIRLREIFLALCFLAGNPLVYSACFPAIFNFGDSTSDTGSLAASFPGFTPAEYPPYGDTYFGHPANRYSDGRLLIDFIAQGYGLPFIDPYLQSVNSEYTQGTNFAAAGSTVLQVTYLSPFYLDIQLREYRTFKTNVQNVFAPPDGSVPDEAKKARLPAPEDFQTGLYTIALGGNDFTFGYTKGQTIAQVREYFPLMIGNLTSAIKNMYDYGGRNFIVWDIEPHGCLPYMLVLINHTPADLDANGCIIAYNDNSKFFNDQLSAALASLRADLKDINVSVFKTYDLKLDLVTNLTQNGFQFQTKACCGVPNNEYNFDLRVNCGLSNVFDGVNLTAVKCSDPNQYVVWDGVHNTDAANRYIANQFFSGRYFDPPFAVVPERCTLAEI
ncbi:hypothetical protein R1sor_001327 [Riccia sorocarpa]|uniref:GDSL esterase/lipase n=1 Tax=Riccia sorocarpa TaxID=122646 RepID=A0ABD3GYX6_9MARC